MKLHYSRLMTRVALAVAVAGASMALGACTGDLDLTPTNPKDITPDKFAADPKGYMEEVMADVYLNFATYGPNGSATVQGFDGGMSTFQRGMFILQEVPTDEACWLPADADYGLFQYGIVPADNTVIMGVYSRLYINIALCNQFIQTVRDGYYNVSSDPALQAEADEFVRQARILRDGCYWYVVDCFGNGPWADENVRMGQVAPQLASRAELYQTVVNDLEDIVAQYKALDPRQRAAYGYVGLDVAEALLVKFYLNAGVYTGSTNWTKTIEHAEAIIARLKGPGFQGSGLADHYIQLFANNNDQYAIGGANAVNEIIWNIPQNQPNLLSYANGTFMVNGWIGTNTEKDSWHCDMKADYNSGNGWKCMVARRQFVEKFAWNADFTDSPDSRTWNWKTAADGFNINNTLLDQGHYGNNGFLPTKFTNFVVNSDGVIDRAASPAPTDQLPIDYPMIRLAEIYLSAAEAYLQNGDEPKALAYVNLIRRRAGLSDFPTLDYAGLQDERCRELYTEATRRSDLIRYGKWISGYTWSWKNNVPSGADFDSRFVLYPLPKTFVERNGYVQNPGY